MFQCTSNLRPVERTHGWRILIRLDLALT